MDPETFQDVRRMLLLLSISIESSASSNADAVKLWEVARRGLKAVQAGHVDVDGEVDAELEDYLGEDEQE